MPKISVILPTYNGSKYIAQAIESVLSQNFKNFELIVINDASTDQKIPVIVSEFQKKDDRVIYFCNDKNQERSWSKNRGVQESSGEYIAFIDDDDIWLDSGKLEKQSKILDNDASIGVVGTAAITISESGDLLGNLPVPQDDSKIRERILISNSFIQSSVLVRRSVFESVSGFPGDLNLCEDYDLWLRVGKVSKFSNIGDYCVQYRIRSSSTTSRNIFKMKWISIKLTWKYRTFYPGFLFSLLIRSLTFLLPITLISRIRRFMGL